MPDVVDLSEFFKLSRPRRKPCPIGNLVLPKLSAKDKKALVAALDTDKGIITSSAIEAWLKKRDHTVSVGAIVSHRKATCSCHDDE